MTIVTVKRGATIVEIGWDNVFGELLTAVDPDLHSEVVSFHSKFTLSYAGASASKHVLVVPFPVFLPAIRVSLL